MAKELISTPMKGVPGPPASDSPKMVNYGNASPAKPSGAPSIQTPTKK